jgi:putative redox protein
MMEGKVTWDKEMTFSATSGSGHTITLDAAPEAGGMERGPLPMELRRPSGSSTNPPAPRKPR